jgi:hypothetical protein
MKLCLKTFAGFPKVVNISTIVYVEAFAQKMYFQYKPRSHLRGWLLYQDHSDEHHREEVIAQLHLDRARFVKLARLIFLLNKKGLLWLSANDDCRGLKSMLHQHRGKIFFCFFVFVLR